MAACRDRPVSTGSAAGQLTPAQAGTQLLGPISPAGHWIRRKQVLGGLAHKYYIAS
jgi:hypothetical protein